jgi:IS5 family transposase
VQTICAKIPDEVAEKLRRVAADSGVSVSELVRALITSRPVKTAAVKEAEREKLHQLHRIGNNLNQIARRCNVRRAVDRQALEALVRIEKELKRLLP